MKRAITIAITTAVVALLVGCQSVPQNEWTLNLKDGTVSVKTPKDITFTNFVAGMQDGKWKVSIGSYSSVNSPDVLGVISANNARTLENTLAFGTKLFEAGAAGATKAFLPESSAFSAVSSAAGPAQLPPPLPTSSMDGYVLVRPERQLGNGVTESALYAKRGDSSGKLYMRAIGSDMMIPLSR